MPLNIGLLEIERLIIHEIPYVTSEQKKKGIPLTVTDKESVLTPENRNYVSEKIKHCLAKILYPSKFDPNTESPVPRYVFEILNEKTLEENRFVSYSQKIATYLYQSQTGVNSAGILTIVKGKFGNTPALGILKLEKEEGMQIEPNVDNAGLTNYVIKQLGNLLLTSGKLFKIALFVQNNNSVVQQGNEQEEGRFNSIESYISDKQSGGDTKVATFFLETFLGCYLLDSPEMTTEKFYKTSQNFINLQVENQERRIQYEMALLSVMNNNDETLSPEDFAHSYLDLDDRQGFLDYLSRDGVPTTTFNKNINSIKTAIKFMRLSLGKDLILSLPISQNPESLGDNIKVKSIDKDKVEIIITAELGRLGR